MCNKWDRKNKYIEMYIIFIQNSTSQLKININYKKGNIEAELEMGGQNEKYIYEIKNFESDKEDYIYSGIKN